VKFTLEKSAFTEQSALKVRAPFAKNKVRFERAQQLWS